MDWIQYEKQCYRLARNQQQYLADGSFNQRIRQTLSMASLEEQEEAIAVLEQMVSHGELFREAEKVYAPILIYKSEAICYGVLNRFADCMGQALEAMGESVEYFDAGIQPLDDLRAMSKNAYKAILGFQSYLFSIHLVNGEILHNYFKAPKYNMQLDHPTVMHKHWLEAPNHLTVLTHDRNYQRYLKTYYGEYVKCEILPPGGERHENPPERKIYDLTFVGSYGSWKQWVAPLKQLNREKKGLARKVIYRLKHHPHDTYEDGVMAVMKEQALSCTTEAVRELSYELRHTYICVMNYYRARIVHTLLEQGIELHVFGDSWNHPDLAGCSSLVRHPSVTQEEALAVYAQSRLSLNIMSWHKDGMTERIANMMLARTVVLSDTSTYLEQHFVKGEELVLFDLTKPEELCVAIRQLLKDPERLLEIAQKGYEAALDRHTWQQRAMEFLRLVERDRTTDF